MFLKQSLEEQLATLTADFEQATSEKVKCQQKADATNATIALANRLVGGLASENIRWADSVARYASRGKKKKFAAQPAEISDE